MSGERKEISKKENNKINLKNMNKQKLIFFIGILILLTYVLYTIYLLIIQPTKTFTVEEGSLYHEESNIGYVIRDEIVVQGENYKNGLEQIKTEGEKTSKDEQIFRYYSNNEDQLEKKIEELDIKIQETMSNESMIYPADVKLIENQIDEKLENMVDVTSSEKLAELKKEIDELILQKAKIAGELSPSGSYLNELIVERKEYENVLNSGAEYVTAPMSGIVSYKVDGFENILTPDGFNTLTIDFLEGLDLKTGKVATTSEESGKVIDNFTYYIATYSDSEEANLAEIGDRVNVRLASGKEIKTNITYLYHEDDETLMILETNEGIEELTDARKITLDLIWWDDQGLKIPNEAIIEKEGLNYVVRNRQGYLNELLIKIERKGEKYSIVEPYSTEELEELGYTSQEIINYRKITIYDEILLEPNLEDLK